MGIDVYVLNFLLNFKGRTLGDTLCLGRQGFHISPAVTRTWNTAQEVLSRFDPEATLSELVSDDGYSEKFLRFLGSRTVASLDFSPFEGADIIFDMNKSLPHQLEGRFDFIFDGGTLEHIYNFPRAVRNVKRMLRLGGLFVSVNGANNQLGHGLYQFSPELFSRVFAPESGFVIEKMQLVPITGAGIPVPVDVADPAGVRHEWAPTPHATYIMVAVRRDQTGLREGEDVYQSDYIAAWRNLDAANTMPVRGQNEPTGKTDRVEAKHEAVIEEGAQSEALESEAREGVGKRHSGGDDAHRPGAALSRLNTVHSVWKELNNLLDEALARIETPHAFMDRFFMRLGGGKELYFDFIKQWQAWFEKSLLKSLRNPLAISEIPALTHRIWVTSWQTPALPLEEYLTDYLRSVRALPADATHFFWTNSNVVHKHLVAKAANAGCRNVVVMDIELFYDDPLFDRLDRLLSDNKYVLAADILKILVLDRFGGIYSDLGVVYDEPLFHLIRLAEYGLIVGENAFFQTSFVASAPRSDLTSMFLAILNHPAALHRSFALMDGRAVSPLDEVHVFAGPGFTACAMLFLPPTARVVMLPGQSRHLVWRAQESWYGSEPKYGNAIVANTQVSTINTDEFIQAEKQYEACVRIYGDLPSLLSEQIRALVITQPYFAQHPTRFCRSLCFNGSDKAQSWHNYGYFYNYILGRMVGRIRNMLEVGIGTNNLDVPSNMGATGIPGASLRAWKELFPLAAIKGADVDSRILFRDDGIETYFVDQNDGSTVRQLFEAIGDRRLDLIIDDGLHAYQANRTLLEGGYPYLESNGLYIIEDVPQEDIAAWGGFLVEGGYDAALVRLPHSSPATDNSLIVISGRRNRS